MISQSAESRARRIKNQLSDDESSRVRERIDDATETLEGLSELLERALHFQEGHLSTGDISYAAFRIETLSLIFETAREHFLRLSKGNDAAYKSYLEDLGDRTGFTFARDLLVRLKSDDYFSQIAGPFDLLELWTLYENDTGAGTTSIVRSSEDQLVIRLADNPLRAMETIHHSNCHFYTSYIRTLVHVMYAGYAKYREEQIEGLPTHITRLKPIDCVESEPPDLRKDEHVCTFTIHLGEERLSRAFGELLDAYDILDQARLDSSQYSRVQAQARAAIEAAEMVYLSIEAPPTRDELNVFRKLIGQRFYRDLQEVYGRMSVALHATGRGVDNSHPHSWYVELLRNSRRIISQLEDTESSVEEIQGLLNDVRLEADIAKLKQLVTGLEISADEKAELSRFLEAITSDELDDESMLHVGNKIRLVGGQSWDLFKQILVNVASELVKQRLGL